MARFKPGDKVLLFTRNGLPQYDGNECEVTGIEEGYDLGQIYDGPYGKSEYIVYIKCGIKKNKHWNSFMRLVSGAPALPLDSRLYDDAIAATEIMESLK